MRILCSRLCLHTLLCHGALCLDTLTVVYLSLNENFLSSFRHSVLKLLSALARSDQHLAIYVIAALKYVREYRLGVGVLHELYTRVVKRKLYPHRLAVVVVLSEGEEAVSNRAAIRRLVGYLTETGRIIFLGWEMRYYLKALRVIKRAAFILYLIYKLCIAVLVKAELDLDAHRALGISELRILCACEKLALLMTWIISCKNLKKAFSLHIRPFFYLGLYVKRAYPEL